VPRWVACDVLLLLRCNSLQQPANPTCSYLQVVEAIGDAPQIANTSQLAIGGWRVRLNVVKHALLG